jgi:hypothetical protein
LSALRGTQQADHHEGQNEHADGTKAASDEAPRPSQGGADRRAQHNQQQQDDAPLAAGRVREVVEESYEE